MIFQPCLSPGRQSQLDGSNQPILFDFEDSTAGEWAWHPLEN